jgi:5-methylcytosine-specific restriction endonuclease McrA
VTSRACVECCIERNNGTRFKTIEGQVTFFGKVCRHGHDGLRYTKNGICVHCAREKAATQRREDPDKSRKLNAVWRSKNKQKLAKDKAAYAKADRERTRSYLRNAKARKRNAPGYHVAAEVRAIREIQGDKCFYCKVNLNGAGHADHFTPLIKGGSNWAENICLACSECNLSKGAKDPLVWLLEKEFTGIVAIPSGGNNPIWIPGRQFSR